MTDKATHTPLPCPFCSGKAEVHEGSDPRYPWSVKSFHEESCFLMYSNVNRHRSYATEAEALTAWNARAVNSHHDLIEALRGLLDEIGKSGCADTILDSAAAGKAFAVIAEVEGRRG